MGQCVCLCVCVHVCALVFAYVVVVLGGEVGGLSTGETETAASGKRPLILCCMFALTHFTHTTRCLSVCTDHRSYPPCRTDSSSRAPYRF